MQNSMIQQSLNFMNLSLYQRTGFGFCDSAGQTLDSLPWCTI